jgi:broad specificity phosphatase PhoE
MKIYLIRHGETTSDLEDRYGGDYDDPLTERGKLQAQEIADELKDIGIQIIFHSPKLRASETAQIISQVINAPLEVVENIRERNNYGILTGMAKSEAKEKYPFEVEKLQSYIHDVQDSEDYESFKTRVLEAFHDITREKYDTVAIVTHGGPICCLIRELFKFGECKVLEDCATLEIDVNRDQYTLISIQRAELQ